MSDSIPSRIAAAGTSLFLLVGAFCVAGCGSESPSEPGSASTPADRIDRGDQTSRSDPSDDPTDEQVERGACASVSCSGARRCVGGTCMSPQKAACETATDLGELGADAPIRWTGDFKGATDSLETGCGASGTHPERVYELQVPQTSYVEVASRVQGTGEIRVEFRQAGCAVAEPLGEHGRCMETDRSVFAPEGSSWHVVVEKVSGEVEAFSLELTARPTRIATPVGEYGCEGGDRYLVERLDGEIRKNRLECPAGCAEGACRGNSCRNPVVVDAAEGESVSGRLGSFTPRFDFGEMGASCRVDGVAAGSDGSEVVFRVEDVEKGREIVVDTSSDRNDNLVYFAKTCPSTSSDFRCAKTGGDRAKFRVPSGGDWFVVVDKYSNASGAFDYEVRIE